MSNLTYVRWQRDEPRPCRVFDPLTEEHPAYFSLCLACDLKLGNGAPVQLVAVEPSDPEDREKFERGGWVTAAAVLLHESCVSDMSAAGLEQFVSQLRVSE